MALQTTYSIYVRFRGRRLALMKHIRSLESARTSLQALRAERFHDADQVFLVNDATKQVVDERAWDDAREPGADREISVSTQAEADDQRGDRAREAGAQAAPAPRGAKSTAPLEAHEVPAPRAASAEREAQAEDKGRREPPERRSPAVEGAEPPRTRLRRAMAAAQAARARHEAALEAMSRLQPGGKMDEMTLMRLNDSARMASDRSARVLEQLEQLLKRLEGAR
ncbi:MULTISPECIES: hypothetical protein [Sorangium]|uniref:Uncharacterized protein n=1 Tax=Sorangium cellulosum TaxID=56 RepID=A0A4P2QJI6_SORCE|nr:MULTISPECIES: hypothetical protein [Sorangium]AUX30144.1 hypothetical protein SOCE836_022410 [Sorangium cellulosum]WCQ89535.1 hypothetical protein NQZ70_02224 [Sorangium sp. Soce836]